LLRWHGWLVYFPAGASRASGATIHRQDALDPILDCTPADGVAAGTAYNACVERAKKLA